MRRARRAHDAGRSSCRRSSRRRAGATCRSSAGQAIRACIGNTVGQMIAGAVRVAWCRAWPSSRSFASVFVASSATVAHAADPCATPVTNPIACENTKPGSPPSEWQPDSQDETIVGFATKYSVSAGETQTFKVKTNAPYTVDVYRLGYYGGERRSGRLRRSAPPHGTNPRASPTPRPVSSTAETGRCPRPGRCRRPRSPGCTWQPSRGMTPVGATT